jgi:hypothetical protein
LLGRERRFFGLGLGWYGWSRWRAMGAHSKAQLILEGILDTSEFFWRHACMKEANETKGGGEVRGVKRKRARRRKFNTKSRQTNTRVSTSLPSAIHSTLSLRNRLLFSVYFSYLIYLFLTVFSELE